MKSGRFLPKPFLAGGVPDLQFDRLPTYVDHSGAELHADGVVGVLFDCVVVRETLPTVSSQIL